MWTPHLGGSYQDQKAVTAVQVTHEQLKWTLLVK